VGLAGNLQLKFVSSFRPNKLFICYRKHRNQKMSGMKLYCGFLKKMSMKFSTVKRKFMQW